MTSADHETNRILIAVPIGEQHAEGWRKIHQRADIWAPTTFRFKLAALVEAGAVRRREEQTPSGARFLYWRDSAGKAEMPHDILSAG